MLGAESQEVVELRGEWRHEEGFRLIYPQAEWGSAAMWDRFAWRLGDPLPLPGPEYWRLPVGTVTEEGPVETCPVCGLPGLARHSTGQARLWWHASQWWCDVSERGEANFGLGEG